MRGNEELPTELKALEAQLAALVPEDQRLDRAKLLFAAGRASARRGSNMAARFWATGCGAMSVVAAALAVVILLRPEPPVRIVERIIHAPAATEHAANGADTGVPGPSTGVPGPERSGGPATDMPATSRPLPERTSLVAAMLFGSPEEYGSPIRRAAGPWRLGDWDLSDAAATDAHPVTARPSHELPPGEEKKEMKTSRQLFDELTKAQG